MLSAKHQITTYKQGKAYPKFLKPTAPHLALAEVMLNLLPALIGEPKERVESQLSEVSDFNPKVVGGLMHTLLGRCVFSQADSQAAAAKRQIIFDQAAKYWSTQVMPETTTLAHRQTIAKSLPEFAPHWEEHPLDFLFGDLSSNQKLLSFDPFEPDELLARYNLGQAQALLCKADSLQVTLTGQTNISQLLQMLKFFGLLFAVSQQNQDSISLQVDGPTSVLETAKSYGVELANFFPAVLNLSGTWELSAPVRVTGKTGQFMWHCSNQDKYRSHYPKRLDWSHERIQAVAERFNQKYGPQYSLSLVNKVIGLKGNQYLLPDFELHQGGTKKQVQWLRYISLSQQKKLVAMKSQWPKNYRFIFKGKQAKYQGLVEQLAPHLILFTSEMTAPFLKKIMEAQ